MITGVMLCDDLIFYSRVAATATALSLVVKQAKSPAALLALMQSEHPNAVIIDLQHDGLDLPKLLEELRTAGPPMPYTVAFGSHVLVEALRAAREAGCDMVMPRSQFTQKLEADLPAWLAPRNP